MSTNILIPYQILDPYYDLLAGGGKAALFLSLIDVGLDRLLIERGPMTAGEIVTALELDPHRARKWLVLLLDIGLIEETEDSGDGVTRYEGGPVLRVMARPEEGYFYRDFLRYWRIATSHDIVALLRGAKVELPVQYPPTIPEEVELLHTWMRADALQTLKVITRSFDFRYVRRLLDVGGGDATMACELAARWPHLELSVFNVPQAAALARRNIAERGLESHVSVVEGDFREDPLPGGYNVVMFSRVLADWPPELCRELIAKAHAALDPGGWLIICEPFRDQNPDLSIAWEHSYLAYDDFGASVYKPISLYYRMLIDAGYMMISSFPRAEGSVYGVLIAHRP